MPIKKDLSELRRSRGDLAPLPSAETVIAKPLLDAWWKEFQNYQSPNFEKAIPELPLRASWFATGCDRELWYKITDTPESNPSDMASMWRMRMGQLIGEEIGLALGKNLHDDAGQKHGWWAEDVTDLRGLGFPCSSHSDLIYYDHGQAIYVGENKSIGGYQFKRKVGGAGDAEGPSWAHIMQAAVVAVAKDAPTIVVFYITPEPSSPSDAERRGMDEYEKFTGEWHYLTAEFRAAVDQEINREKRILRYTVPDEEGMVWRPERTLFSPEVPPGAVVTEPAKAKWVVYDPATGNVIKSGTKWFCDYCRYRDTCIKDGGEMVKIKLGKHKTLAEHVEAAIDAQYRAKGNKVIHEDEPL